MSLLRTTLALALALLLFPARATGREILVLDASPSVVRRDPDRLTLTAAWAVALSAPRVATVDLYDESGDLFATSRQRESESELIALGDALDRLMAAGTSGGGGDLVRALERVAERERARGDDGDPATRLFLATDGHPSLTVERWETEYAVPAGRLAKDPSGWQRLCRTAHDSRLASVIAALGELDIQVSWIAPAGIAPPAGASRAIQSTGGWVLAGGGITDVESLMDRLTAKDDFSLPLSAEEQVIQVPPGATGLEILYLKPGRDPGALQLGAPGGASTRLLGLGAVAGRETLIDPAPGRWSVRRGDGGRSGVARIHIEAELELAVVAGLSRPGRPGELRTGWVEILDSAGSAVAPEKFERADVTMVIEEGGGISGFPIPLQIVDGRIQAPIELPRYPGTLHLRFAAQLECGSWSRSLETRASIPVADPRIEVSGLPALILAGQEVEVIARVMQEGRPLEGADGELTISGLGAAPEALERQGDHWRTVVVVSEGDFEWTVSGDIAVSDDLVMGVSQEGSLVAGLIDLSIDGSQDESGAWHGELTARSKIPVEIGLTLVAAQDGAPPGGSGVEPLLQAGLPALGEASWAIDLPRPESAGVTRTHLTVLVAGLEAATLTHAVEVSVPTWWQRYGLLSVTITSILIAVAALVMWRLARRPFLQGELQARDLSGRPLVATCELGTDRRILARRSVTIAARQGADLELPAELARPGLALALHPRAGDLGLVFAEIENRGTATVKVSEETLGPGERRLLAHADVIDVGKAQVVFSHPVLVHMQLST